MDNFFEEARDMFVTKGWSNFKAELEQAISVCTLDACDSADAFWQMRGRLQTLRQILGYENSVLASEAQQDEDANAEDI